MAKKPKKRKMRKIDATIVDVLYCGEDHYQVGVGMSHEQKAHHGDVFPVGGKLLLRFATSDNEFLFDVDSGTLLKTGV